MDSPIYRLPPIFNIRDVSLPFAQTIDWGAMYFRVPEMWKRTRGEGVTVAILDTGCDLNHPDLEGAIVDAKDFTGSPYGPQDKQGHGTHTTGIVSARDNTLGMAGIAPACSILTYKVLGDDGSGFDQWIEAGIVRAADKGANVISMSLGSPMLGAGMHEAIKYAIAKGCFIICAAGNDGRPNSVNYPAKFPEPVIVGAIDKQGRLASFSSRGPEMRSRGVVAPGVNIVSTYPGGGYKSMDGTSMATPAIAGVTALMIARHRQLNGGDTPLETQDQLLAHLRNKSIDSGPEGPDDGYGLGAPNMDDLVPIDVPVVPPPAPGDEPQLIDVFGLPFHVPAKAGDRFSYAG